ncbi:hypothetical protein ACFFK0_11770 [Paenibacillus chartarius]|uniref:YD repeat-containing protein n=1 Tax=Paenibacillus chartarius TaxID=747481 RepID=A0ABV6DKI0_9BACL
MKMFSRLFFVLAFVFTLVLPTTASAATETAPSWMGTAIGSKVNTSTQYYAFYGLGTKYYLVVIDKNLFDTSPITGVRAFRTDGESLYTNHTPNITTTLYQYDAAGKLVKTVTTFKIGKSFGIDGGGGLHVEYIYQANLQVLNYNTDDVVIPATN